MDINALKQSYNQQFPNSQITDAPVSAPPPTPTDDNTALLDSLSQTNVPTPDTSKPAKSTSFLDNLDAQIKAMPTAKDTGDADLTPQQQMLTGVSNPYALLHTVDPTGIADYLSSLGGKSLADRLPVGISAGLQNLQNGLMQHINEITQPPEQYAANKAQQEAGYNSLYDQMNPLNKIAATTISHAPLIGMMAGAGVPGALYDIGGSALSGNLAGAAGLAGKLGGEALGAIGGGMVLSAAGSGIGNMIGNTAAQKEQYGDIASDALNLGGMVLGTHAMMKANANVPEATIDPAIQPQIQATATENNVNAQDTDVPLSGKVDDYASQVAAGQGQQSAAANLANTATGFYEGAKKYLGDPYNNLKTTMGKMMGAFMGVKNPDIFNENTAQVGINTTKSPEFLEAQAAKDAQDAEDPTNDLPDPRDSVQEYADGTNGANVRDAANRVIVAGMNPTLDNLEQTAFQNGMANSKGAIALAKSTFADINSPQKILPNEFFGSDATPATAEAQYREAMERKWQNEYSDLVPEIHTEVPAGSPDDSAEMSQFKDSYDKMVNEQAATISSRFKTDDADSAATLAQEFHPTSILGPEALDANATDLPGTIDAYTKAMNDYYTRNIEPKMGTGPEALDRNTTIKEAYQGQIDAGVKNLKDKFSKAEDNSNGQFTYTPKDFQSKSEEPPTNKKIMNSLAGENGSFIYDKKTNQKGYKPSDLSPVYNIENPLKRLRDMNNNKKLIYDYSIGKNAKGQLNSSVAAAAPGMRNEIKTSENSMANLADPWLGEHYTRLNAEYSNIMAKQDDFIRGTSRSVKDLGKLNPSEDTHLVQSELPSQIANELTGKLKEKEAQPAADMLRTQNGMNNIIERLHAFASDPRIQELNEHNGVDMATPTLKIIGNKPTHAMGAPYETPTTDVLKPIVRDNPQMGADLVKNNLTARANRLNHAYGDAIAEYSGKTKEQLTQPGTRGKEILEKYMGNTPLTKNKANVVEQLTNVDKDNGMRTIKNNGDIAKAVYENPNLLNTMQKEGFLNDGAGTAMKQHLNNDLLQKARDALLTKNWAGLHRMADELAPLNAHVPAYGVIKTLSDMVKTEGNPTKLSMSAKLALYSRQLLKDSPTIAGGLAVSHLSGKIPVGGHLIGSIINAVIGANELGSLKHATEGPDAVAGLFKDAQHRDYVTKIMKAGDNQVAFNAQSKQASAQAKQAQAQKLLRRTILAAGVSNMIRGH